eukprot:jgi/Botrbrau1/19128/Bobra.0077s0040.1
MSVNQQQRHCTAANCTAASRASSCLFYNVTIVPGDHTATPAVQALSIVQHGLYSRLSSPQSSLSLDTSMAVVQGKAVQQNLLNIFFSGRQRWLISANSATSVVQRSLYRWLPLGSSAIKAHQLGGPNRARLFPPGMRYLMRYHEAPPATQSKGARHMPACFSSSKTAPWACCPPPPPPGGGGGF